MDTYGSLDLAWTNGYNGAPAEYITEDVICFKCGNTVKFLDSHEGNASKVYSSIGDGLDVLAVHGINRLFAYSEHAINARIFVVQYPSFKEVSCLLGGAQLEFLSLTFSSSDYIASISGVPEYQLVVWRYADGTKLCVQNLQHVSPTYVSFNPGNWREIAVSTDKGLTLWTIEQNNQVYIINKHKPALFAERLESEELHGELTNETSSLSMKAFIQLPVSSITGLDKEKAEEFKEYLDTRERVVPLSHCWTPTGDLLVGCAGGQLVRINGETFRSRIILGPGDYMSVEGGTGDASHDRPDGEVSSKQIKGSGKKSGHGSKGAPGRGSNFKRGISDFSIRSKTNSASRSLKSDFKENRDEDDQNQENVEQQKKDDNGENDFQNTRPSADIIPGSFNCIKLHKRGLYTGGTDGIVRRIILNSDSSATVVEKEDFGIPVSSLSFSSSHNKLAIGSVKGAILLTNSEKLTDVATLCDVHYGNFVAVRPLATNNACCLTLRESGEVQVWSVEDGRIISSVPLGCKACCMGTSPMVNIAVVGSDTGGIYVLDVTVVDNPRIVHSIQLHQGPVNCITFSLTGAVFVTGSTDGQVFVVSGLSSKKFEPLGYTSMPGHVQTIAAFHDSKTDETRVVATAKTEVQLQPGALKLIAFSIPSDLSNNLVSKYESLKCDFKDAVFKKQSFSLPQPVSGLTLADENTLYALSLTSKNLLKMNIPETSDDVKESALVISDQFPGHQLPGGIVESSAHHTWIASAGKDGQIIVRDVSKLDGSLMVSAHNYWDGGVQDLTFLGNGRYILTAGFDGTFGCYRWKFTHAGDARNEMAIRAAPKIKPELRQLEETLLQSLPIWNNVAQSSTVEDKQKEEAETGKDKAVNNDEIYEPLLLKPATNATWLEVKNIEAVAEEGKKYAEVKKKLRHEIGETRRTLQKMLRENEDLPQIEKLARHEFDLDTEEQRRLQAHCDVEVAKIREEKDYENIAKMYLTDIIKKECWDAMVVKGRGLISFNSPLEVYNYPLKERSPEELIQLDVVRSRRKVEIAEFAARMEYAPVIRKKSESGHAHITDDDGVESPEILAAKKRGKLALTGSLAEEVGGECELYYGQFELCSREQKLAQIILIENTINAIKIKFNKEFEDVFARKEAEISKINEKNVRIRQILNDINMRTDVFEPVMDSIEKPEALFTTTDDEVKVEKYFSPAQWKKMDEERRIGEERRLREKGDNWRDRGLDKMMGGVLEIKKEDELKKDVPIPDFLQDRVEADWSEEEKKQALEYKRKVKELEEEREKFKKQLEVEMKKLQQMVQDGTLAFDEVLQQLFAKRIKTELNVLLEELKIVRLRQSLLTEEELVNREQELDDAKERNRKLAQAKSAEVNNSKKLLEEFRTEYDIVIAEDKLLDKSFKRDFSDVSVQLIELLYKQYRRRPRGQRVRNVEPVNNDLLRPSADPYTDRPSTARHNEDLRVALEASLADLNHENNIPEGCDLSVWERLCKHRREKLESEMLIKQKALTLAEMQAFVQKRQAEEERLKNEMEEIYDSANKLRETKQRFVTNLEIQLLLKQGQVEVEPGEFTPDYTNSLLLHRSVIEDLNKRIRQLGEVKIVSMVESKDFRKGIVQLEWEHKKMSMEMMDLKNKMKDVTSMKVTREIQQYLSENDYDSKKNQQVLVLEQTIALLKQHHERHVTDRKEELKELKRSTHQISVTNEELLGELIEMNVTVCERKNIHQDSTEKQIELDRKARYRSLVQRRKIVNLAQAQGTELSLLRTEVERLRMRTFAALAQVDR